MSGNGNIASGVIEVVARNKKAFKLEGGDDWYSVYKQQQLGGAEAGTSVTFTYTTNNKGGKDFLNVQDNVEITAAAPQTRTAGGGSASTKDVSMTRGGAIKVAGDVVMRYYGDAPPAELEDIAKDIITVARLLEEYVYEG